MNEEDIEILISQGEGYNVEFKRSFSPGIAREICAFANAGGGKILIGVDDSGNVVGAESGNELRSKIQDIGRNLDPPVELDIEKVGNILVIHVPEGEKKPYSYSGKFYIRQGPNSQQLSRDEIRDLFRNERLLLFDEIPNERFDTDADLNREVFRKFLGKSGISEVIGEDRILENLQLIENGRMRNAGVLLFCKDVRKFFLNATVTCVLYRGDDRYKILDRKEFSGDILSNFENAFLYLQEHLNTEYIIKGGVREERLELPEEALREALLNAIAHRDYFSTANIQVSVFRDRVEISNPGGLIGNLRVEDLYERSIPRNPLLFGLMQRMGLVERVGSGLVRIRKALEMHGLPEASIEADRDWFVIRFHRRAVEKTVEKTVEKSEDKILRLIRENPAITHEELAEITGLSRRGVEWNIKKLKEKGIIKRVGGKKGGHWEITEGEK